MGKSVVATRRGGRHSGLLALALGASCAFMAGVLPASAQTTAAEIAQYQGEDRQAKLEEGARQEGAILLYTTGTQIQPLLDRFVQIYPFIAVETFRAPASEVAQKAAEEFRAGYFEVDGFELSSEALIGPRDLGVLAPFWSPETEHFSSDGVEAGGHWVSARESYGGIGYNTDLIPPDQAPKTWQDLLKPEYRGKMGISGSPSSSAQWLGLLLVSYGEDFLRELAKQEIRVYSGSGRAVADLVVAGEVPITVRASNAHFAESLADGAHIAWVAPGPVEVTDTVVAIAANAPHPHAMMLLIDFLLSTEGQTMYREIGYESARTDMVSENAPTEKVYLANRPDYFREYEDWGRLFNELFVNR